MCDTTHTGLDSARSSAHDSPVFAICVNEGDDNHLEVFTHITKVGSKVGSDHSYCVFTNLGQPFVVCCVDVCCEIPGVLKQIEVWQKIIFPVDHHVGVKMSVICRDSHVKLPFLHFW